MTQGKKQAPLVAFKSQLKSDIYNEKNYNSFSARAPAPVQRDISALKSTVD